MFELAIFTTIPRAGFEWVDLRPISRNLAVGATSEPFLVDPWVLSPLKVSEQEWVSVFAEDVTDDIENVTDDDVKAVIGSHGFANTRFAYPFANVVPAFDRFAAVEMHKDAILEFANTNGDLGILRWGATSKCRKRRMSIPAGESLESSLSGKLNRNWHPFVYRAFKAGIVYGEPLSDWLDNLKAMKLCVRLFRAILVYDEHAIDTIVECLNEVESDDKDCIPWIFTKDDRAKIKGKELQDEEIKRAAGHLITWVASGQMHKSNCVTDLTFTDGDQSFSFSVEPRSVRDAMWFEFAAAVQDMKDFRECEICKHLFRVGDDGSIKSRRYCSSKCRSQAKRHRQKKARQLRADGMHLRQIAKELGVDKMETVKGWVKDVPMP